LSGYWGYEESKLHGDPYIDLGPRQSQKLFAGEARYRIVKSRWRFCRWWSQALHEDLVPILPEEETKRRL